MSPNLTASSTIFDHSRLPQRKSAVKIKLIFLLIFLIATVLFGQKTFVIDDFSSPVIAN